MLHFQNLSLGDSRRMSCVEFARDVILVGTHSGAVLCYKLDLSALCHGLEPSLANIVYPPAHDRALCARITAVKLSHCMQYLAVGLVNGIVVVYAVQNMLGKVTFLLKSAKHGGFSISALAWSLDNSKLYSGCCSGRVMELDLTVERSDTENKIDEAFKIAVSFFGGNLAKSSAVDNQETPGSHGPFAKVVECGTTIKDIETSMKMSEDHQSLCDCLLVATNKQVLRYCTLQRSRHSQAGSDCPSSKNKTKIFVGGLHDLVTNPQFPHSSLRKGKGSDRAIDVVSDKLTVKPSAACFLVEPCLALSLKPALSRPSTSQESTAVGKNRNLVDSPFPLDRLSIDNISTVFGDILYKNGSKSGNGGGVNREEAFAMRYLPEGHRDASVILWGMQSDEKGGTTVATYSPADQAVKSINCTKVFDRKTKSHFHSSDTTTSEFTSYHPVYTDFGKLLTVIAITARGELAVISLEGGTFQLLTSNSSSEVLSVTVSDIFVLVVYSPRDPSGLVLMPQQVDILQCLDPNDLVLPCTIYSGPSMFRSISNFQLKWRLYSQKSNNRDRSSSGNLLTPAHFNLVDQNYAEEGKVDATCSSPASSTFLRCRCDKESNVKGSADDKPRSNYRNEQDFVILDHRFTEIGGKESDVARACADNGTTSSMQQRGEGHVSHKEAVAVGDHSWQTGGGIWIDAWLDKVQRRREARISRDNKGIMASEAPISYMFYESQQELPDTSYVTSARQRKVALIEEECPADVNGWFDKALCTSHFLVGTPKANVYHVDISLTGSSLGLNIGIERATNLLRVVSFSAMPPAPNENDPHQKTSSRLKHERNYAKQCGLIRPGDVLVAIGDMDVSSLSADEALSVLKKTVSNAKFNRPSSLLRHTSCAIKQCIRLTFMYHDAVEASRDLNDFGTHSGDSSNEEGGTWNESDEINDEKKNPLFDIFGFDNPGAGPMSMLTTEALSSIGVELKRSNQGFSPLKTQLVFPPLTPSLFLLDQDEVQYVANHQQHNRRQNETPVITGESIERLMRKRHMYPLMEPAHCILSQMDPVSILPILADFIWNSYMSNLCRYRSIDTNRLDNTSCWRSVSRDGNKMNSLNILNVYNRQMISPTIAILRREVERVLDHLSINDITSTLTNVDDKEKAHYEDTSVLTLLKNETLKELYITSKEYHIRRRNSVVARDLIRSRESPDDDIFRQANSFPATIPILSMDLLHTLQLLENKVKHFCSKPTLNSRISFLAIDLTTEIHKSLMCFFNKTLVLDYMSISVIDNILTLWIKSFKPLAPASRSSKIRYQILSGATFIERSVQDNKLSDENICCLSTLIDLWFLLHTAISRLILCDATEKNCNECRGVSRLLPEFKLGLCLKPKPCSSHAAEVTSILQPWSFADFHSNFDLWGAYLSLDVLVSVLGIVRSSICGQSLKYKQLCHDATEMFVLSAGIGEKKRLVDSDTEVKEALIENAAPFPLSGSDETTSYTLQHRPIIILASLRRSAVDNDCNSGEESWNSLHLLQNYCSQGLQIKIQDVVEKYGYHRETDLVLAWSRLLLNLSNWPVAPVEGKYAAEEFTLKSSISRMTCCTSEEDDEFFEDSEIGSKIEIKMLFEKSWKYSDELND